MENSPDFKQRNLTGPVGFRFEMTASHSFGSALGVLYDPEILQLGSE